MQPPAHLFLDGIGPFFRAARSERINWSKIPFADLPTDAGFWQRLESDFERLLDQIQPLGYNGVTLDDLAHLTPHPRHDAATNDRIQFLGERFAPLFARLKQRGLFAWITSDVLTLSPAAAESLGTDHQARSEFYFEQVERFFDRFPSVGGMILRIGESDGLDVRDPLRSHLHLTSARAANRFLRDLLPRTQALHKQVILRTWTVGAHRIGDLIWHHGRLAQCLAGLENQPNFLVSMKPGASDFFRHLPLNPAFRAWPGPKILELQARPEYEGAGEIPSFLGFAWEGLRAQLAEVHNLAGVSVWAQCGGWHRFRRLTFLDDNAFWAGLNARAAAEMFGHGLPVEQAISQIVGANRAAAATEFLQHADAVMNQLWYLPEFAQSNLWFRRIRLPPLLHVYWDSIFIHSSLRKLLRHFVADPQAALAQAEDAWNRFPRLEVLAQELGWPVDDVRFFRDTARMLVLQREYFFLPWTAERVAKIKAAKEAYKVAWPKSVRPRFRIKTEFRPSRLKRWQVMWASRWLLRRQAGYRRLLDHIVTLHLLAFGYRLLQNRPVRGVPKFLRKSAMGVGSLLK